MEADQAQTEVVNPGNGRIVAINGYLAHDTTGANEAARKKDLRCGRYLYWVGERFNTRNPASADAATLALINSYIANAQLPGTIDLVPAGTFWDSPQDMFVSKNADAGPLAWKNAAGNPANAACND